MPAAAVIPAPIAYIKVVAVKKLVVEFVSRAAGSSFAVLTGVFFARRPAGGLSRVASPSRVRFGVRVVRVVVTTAQLNPAAVLFTECRGGPARLL